MTHSVIAGALVAVFIAGSIEGATFDLDLPSVAVADRVSITRGTGANRKETWAKLDGLGCINHIWITLKHPLHSELVNRKLVIRIYCDGSNVPHVELPVGDFFGVMHGVDSYPINTPWLSAKEYSGYNCYFKMPFAKSARIEFETGGESNHVYLQTDWHRYPDQEMRKKRRFCCRWRKENPTARYGEDFLMLDADGPGQLIGFVYGVRLIDNVDRWSHGGAENIYLDGEGDYPGYLRGIGGEDTTLLVQGPPGVGKTHLCVGLAVKAIEHGFSVAFYRLEDLLHEMRKDASVAPQRLRRKKYFNVAYLVVDEVGFEPMSHQDASLFFRLVSYRYLRGSTAITTNKSVKDWPGIFAGDEAMTAAILDRLLHKSVVLNIRGRSYRLQDLEKLLK